MVCHVSVNGVPFEGPAVQEKSYYIALKMAFELNVQIACSKGLCRL
jgi:hypothetical protein